MNGFFICLFIVLAYIFKLFHVIMEAVVSTSRTLEVYTFVCVIVLLILV